MMTHRRDRADDGDDIDDWLEAVARNLAAARDLAQRLRQPELTDLIGATQRLTGAIRARRR